MSCTSTVVYDGYLWGCSMTTTHPHPFHLTDLPVEYVDAGQAILTWGTNREAAPADATPRYDGPIYERCAPRRFLPAPTPAGAGTAGRAGDVVTPARTRTALLRGPLGQAGAIAGLPAVAVLVDTAATLAFTATVQHVIPAPPTLTTTAPIEGAAP